MTKGLKSRPFCGGKERGMSNFCEFVDGDMTEEDRKKIDEALK